MEICHKAIHRLEGVSGINENLRPAAFGLNHAVFIRYGFQCSCACCANRNNPSAIFLRFIHNRRLLRLYHIILRVHFMLQYILHLHGAKGAQTNMQGNMGNPYPHVFNFL